jgi:hypothetical protein
MPLGQKFISCYHNFFHWLLYYFLVFISLGFSARFWIIDEKYIFMDSGLSGDGVVCFPWLSRATVKKTSVSIVTLQKKKEMPSVVFDRLSERLWQRESTVCFGWCLLCTFLSWNSSGYHIFCYKGKQRSYLILYFDDPTQPNAEAELSGTITCVFNKAAANWVPFKYQWYLSEGKST